MVIFFILLSMFCACTAVHLRPVWTQWETNFYAAAKYRCLKLHLHGIFLFVFYQPCIWGAVEDTVQAPCSSAGLGHNFSAASRNHSSFVIVLLKKSVYLSVLTRKRITVPVRAVSNVNSSLICSQ